MRKEFFGSCWRFHTFTTMKNRVFQLPSAGSRADDWAVWTVQLVYTLFSTPQQLQTTVEVKRFIQFSHEMMENLLTFSLHELKERKKLTPTFLTFLLWLSTCQHRRRPLLHPHDEGKLKCWDFVSPFSTLQRASVRWVRGGNSSAIMRFHWGEKVHMKNVFIWALFIALTQSSESLVAIFISAENFFNIENSFSHFSDFSLTAQSYARLTIRKRR